MTGQERAEKRLASLPEWTREAGKSRGFLSARPGGGGGPCTQMGAVVSAQVGSFLTVPALSVQKETGSSAESEDGKRGIGALTMKSHAGKKKNGWGRELHNGQEQEGSDHKLQVSHYNICFQAQSLHRHKIWGVGESNSTELWLTG